MQIPSPKRFLLFFACFLLFATPLHLHAQDDDEEWPEEFLRNKALLNVVINPNGGAMVGLEFPPEIHDREQLKRALTESFSFAFDLDDVSGAQLPTFISATSPKAFSGGLMTSTCDIDLHPLLRQLQQHQVESLKLAVLFQNGTEDLVIKGAKRVSVGNLSMDRYEADVDVRAGAFPVIHFAIGYSAGTLFKKSLPVALFVLLPALWTTLFARRSSSNPEELWGRHLRFLNRLLNFVWLVWLPVYSFSGVDEVIQFTLGADHPGMAQLVNIAFYFIPPVVAMFLCHFASRRVYERVPAIEWSPSEVVRHAIIANALSLIPLFLVIVGMNSFSSSPRQAVLFLVIGYIGSIILNQNLARLLGSRLHALTSGDLRDRIFDLAQRAGLKLSQVYVLPETRAQLSNAFARSDNCVMITNSLLKNLSRREVDGIMAHEIGHLQARHPQNAITIMVAVIVGVNFVIGFIAWFASLRNATPLVFAVAVGVGNLAIFFRSRRNERQADAIGVSLTGDAEAFISGLAKLSRLNLMPLHSGGWGESLDTHPAAMRRFEQIAKTHGISESRLQELVTDAAPARDRYPSIEGEVDSTVFSTEFKNKYRVRVALVLLSILLVAPVPFALAITVDGLSSLRILVLAIAGFLWSFGVSLLIRNRIGYWGYHSLGRRLRMKLDKRGLGDVVCHGTLVGLAPASESRRYEGYPFWDIGVLWLTKEKLYYVGEQCEFALEREQVNDVYSCDTVPEWLPEKSLFVRWKEKSQRGHKTLHFVSTGAASVSEARRAIDSLQARLQAWMNQSEEFPPASSALQSIVAPVFPEITSEPALLKFVPAYTFKAAIRLAIFAAVVGFAIRLSYTGILYMAVVLFLCTVVDELAKILKRVHMMSEPPPVEAGTYQTGSWMDA